MPMKNLIHFYTDGGTGGDGGGGSGDGGSSQAGGDDGAQGGGGDGGSGSGGGGNQPDPELAKLRQEAAKYRTERNALQKRVEELEGAGKTEVEKLTGSVTSLTDTNRNLMEQNRRLVVQVVAGRVGIAPEARADAAALLPADAVSDWADEKKVEKALRDLVRDKPYLTGRTGGGADGGEGGSRDEPQDMNSLIRAAAGRG